MNLSFRGAGTPRSGIREMFDRASSMGDVVNLGVGEPGFDTPAHIIDAAVRGIQNGYTKYTPNAGIYPLRQAIAEKLARENGLDSLPENIVVTSGACEAISLALFVLTDAGDEILIPDPCWPNYSGQVSVSGSIPIPVSTHQEERFHICAEAIEDAISSKTKGIILNSPSNPTGALLSEKELLKIAQVVKENSLFVISDEPYEKLIYDDAKYCSIGSLKGMSEHVLTINSFSKSYAMTGWRVGYLRASVEVADAIAKMQENFSSCVNSAAQFGAIEAITGSQEDTQMMRESYSVRRNMIVDGLNSIDGITCLLPEGAFYAFPDISKFGLTSKEFAIRLLEDKGVVTVPGDAFGSCGEGHIRMSFAAPEEAIRSAVARIEDFVSLL